jgi:hypothetical protein
MFRRLNIVDERDLREAMQLRYEYQRRQEQQAQTSRTQ